MFWGQPVCMFLRSNFLSFITLSKWSVSPSELRIAESHPWTNPSTDVRSSPLHPLCAIHFSLQYLKESSSQTFFQSVLLKFLDPSKQFVIPFNTVHTPESPVKGFKKKKTNACFWVRTWGRRGRRGEVGSGHGYFYKEPQMILTCPWLSHCLAWEKGSQFIDCPYFSPSPWKDWEPLHYV